MFWTELADKNSYKASIGAMRLRLAKLQELDNEVWKIRAAKMLQDEYKEVDEVLHYQGLLFISKIIWIELISWFHNNLLLGHFGIDKTKEFIGQKYYWLNFRKNVNAYKPQRLFGFESSFAQAL